MDAAAGGAGPAHDALPIDIAYSKLAGPHSTHTFHVFRCCYRTRGIDDVFRAELALGLWRIHDECDCAWQIGWWIGRGFPRTGGKKSRLCARGLLRLSPRCRSRTTPGCRPALPRVSAIVLLVFLCSSYSVPRLVVELQLR
jgi:hypothetical protein